MKISSLVLVGSGIKSISHLTTEAKAYIRESDKVLYLVNEPFMKEWIQKNSCSSESLDELYVKHAIRMDCYRGIKDYILKCLRKNENICVVLYGHPTVFSRPGLEAVLQARKEGYDAKILPGISAEDCLFADLAINPGTCGCQSYEATDFLIYCRKFDSSSHLILWQVGIIGELGHPKSHDNTAGAKILLNYLSKQYPLDHEVILYEASQYPHISPKIVSMSLRELPKAKFSSATTLYVPPAKSSVYDINVLNALGIKDISETI